MSDDTLRDEILGDDGFANWLRGKRLSGKALAEQAQARIQAELGAVSCANVNDYLCRLLDAEYEIYLETERELIEGAVEAFLTADDAIGASTLRCGACWRHCRGIWRRTLNRGIR